MVSAVHRSRRAGAGAGVLPYFAGAGAGAGVCSPPAKLRQHLFVLQTSIIDQRKTNSIEEKAAQYSSIQLDTNIQIIIMVFYAIFV